MQAAALFDQRPAGDALHLALAGYAENLGDGRVEVVVEGARAADFLLGHDEWGARWIASHRAKQAAAQA